MIRPELLPGHLRRIGIVEKRLSNVCNTSVEERSWARIFFQHGAHFTDQRGVMGACCVKEGVLFGCRAGRRFGERGFECAPTGCDPYLSPRNAKVRDQ